MQQVISTTETPQKEQKIKEVKSIFMVWNWVYYLLGVIETLLAFRFALKLLGANPGNWFASLIYTATDQLLAPFFGIFTPPTTLAATTIEPDVIIAMFVYAVVGWGVAKIVEIKLSTR